MMKKIHPELYNYCMKKLGLDEVISYIRSGGKTNLDKFIKGENK